MATVREVMLERWRTGRYLGGTSAQFYMTLRSGEFRRDYSDWFGGDVKAFIPTHSKPWQATWTPTGPWRDVPSLFEVNIEQSFDNNGIASATITIENIHMEAFGGGTFHRLLRGYFSPMRGYAGSGRPPVGEKNEWFDTLKRKSQVMIYGGYGDAGVPLFTGLINDVDLTSAPDRITVTARDFGQVLTDQRLFGTVKDKALPDPITFKIGKRAELDDTFKVGGAARASSEEHDHPARYVCDGGATFNNDSRWFSDGHDAPNVTEWVQIKIPRGRYLTFYLDPSFVNMEMYISVFVYDRAPGKPSQWNNVDVPQGWLNLGVGEVPGANGGFPYIKQATAAGDGKYWTLGGQLECGDRSVLRISFRNLGEHRNLRPGHEHEVKYRAGVGRLFAVRREANQQLAKGKQILVEDLSDVVKVVLRWAGFKEWEVETVGNTELGDKNEGWSFEYNASLMDVINKAQEATGYVFYIKPPEGLEQIGIPVFRSARALDTAFEQPGDVIEIRDTQLFREDRLNTAGLLGAINARFTDDPLAMSIRVRGREATKEEGGVTLGSDKVRKVQYQYRPPWTDDMAGVIKHIVFQNPGLRTELECKIACLLIAVQAAMKSATATFEIPMYPFFLLDEKVAIVDTGTGLSTRVYIAQRSITLRSGEQRSARMTLAGALLDTPEFDAVKNDLGWALVEKFFGGPAVIGSQQQTTTGSRNLAPVGTTGSPPRAR